MNINGREVRFFYSVGAKYEIDNLKTDDLFLKTVETAVITSRAYVQAMKFRDPSFDVKPLTKEEVLSFDDKTFEAVVDLMAASYEEGMNVTVEAEGKKKDEASS